jgi:hypothetical protein
MGGGWKSWWGECLQVSCRSAGAWGRRLGMLQADQDSLERLQPMQSSEQRRDLDPKQRHKPDEEQTKKHHAAAAQRGATAPPPAQRFAAAPLPAPLVRTRLSPCTTPRRVLHTLSPQPPLPLPPASPRKGGFRAAMPDERGHGRASLHVATEGPPLFRTATTNRIARIYSRALGCACRPPVPRPLSESETSGFNARPTRHA